MTAEPMIGDREKLRYAEQRIRDIYVALADYLTDRKDYDIPHEVIRAGSPDVPDDTRESAFRALLLATSVRGPDRSRPLPLDAETDLDYLTGARK